MTNNAINSNMPIEVAKGGTGAATFTQYSPLIGHATSAIGVITPGNNGEVLIAATGLDPAFAALTSPNSTITFTAGAATLSMDITGATGKVTTFSPVLSFGGGTTGITYTTARCWYNRIGNFISFTINMLLTNKGSSTGAAAISLPINTATGKFAVNIIQNANTLSFSGRLVAYADGGLIYLMDSADGSAASAITNTNFANNTGLAITGCYLV